MKLTYEEKCEIYRKWKYEGYGCNTLGHIYGINRSKANYIVRLADKHGIEALKHKHTYYSSEFRLKAIDRVFDGESITEVSIDLGITSSGILPTWIKEYKQNGYSIIELKKGRKKDERENLRILRKIRLCLRCSLSFYICFNIYRTKKDLLVSPTGPNLYLLN